MNGQSLYCFNPYISLLSCRKLISNLVLFMSPQVRLQTQDFKNPKYRGTWHCITDTIRHESVSGSPRAPWGGILFTSD